MNLPLFLTAYDPTNLPGTSIDLLPNVLGLSRIDDKSYAAGIALQRKLQGITCRVLMAQGAYRGRPGLRTEIRPIPLPFGRLHAKCFAVEYERAVLVSIGSTNLTTQGFRKNREVAGVMLTRHDDAGQASTILEALGGAIRSLETVQAPWITPMLDDLAATREKVQGWHPTAPVPSFDSVERYATPTTRHHSSGS